MEIVKYISENSETLVAIVTGIVTVASLITNLIPGEADNAVVAKIKKAVDWAALNFKK